MSVNRDLVQLINKEIWDNDDYENEMYYEIMCKKCNNLDYYFERHKVINPLDKIYIAQEWMDFEIVKRELSTLSLTEYQKNKLEELKSKNNAWFETLNIEILDEKYSFLDKYLDFLTTDLRTQQLLLSLNDEELILFSKMVEKLSKETSNPIPYICRFLDLVGTSITAPLKSLPSYDGKKMFSKKSSNFKLISETAKNEDLTEKDIELLLYIFTNNNFEINVNSISELRHFEDNLLSFVNESINTLKEKKEYATQEIENIKSLLLLRSYGISLDYALSLLKKFNLNGINISSFNEIYIEMYKSIANIANENNVNKLFEIYDEINKNCDFNLDYMTVTLFENGMRDIFLKHLNDSTFKCNTDDYVLEDGVKIFDAGTDFKIILTSVGAYQPELATQSNYSTYWNNNSIRSHGICCSLISNSNLSTASIRNICLGFSNFEDGTLLLSSPSDLNSTPISRQVNIQDHPAAFMNVNSLIDNTRSDYNELVFERRNLSQVHQYYKKNPDYIVMFEELDDINSKVDEETKKLLSEQERIKRISIQAAKDFGIPIVKVNREKCAISESRKINKMVEDFYETHDPALLNRIVINYENNRMGLRYPHDYLREKYFPKERINGILNKLIEEINNIEDSQLKIDNSNTLRNVITLEYNKFKTSQISSLLHHSQEPGINFENITNLLQTTLLVEKKIAVEAKNENK